MTTINVSIPLDMRAWLSAYAAHQHISVSAVIRQSIARYRREVSAPHRRSQEKRP